MIGPILLAIPAALAGYIADATPISGLALSQANPDGTSYHGGGVALVDFDGDGLLDVYATDKSGPNVLAKNLGGFRFVEVPGAAGAALAGHDSVGVAAGDLDGDGDLDLVVSGWSGARLLESVGAAFVEREGAFEVDGALPGHATALALGDPDRDGDLDVVIGHNTPHVDLFAPDGSDPGVYPDDACLPNRFYENLGGLGFRERAAELGIDDEGCAMGLAWTDADGDGDADLLVDNDHGRQWRSDQLFENRSGPGGLAFRPVAAIADRVRINGMGIAVGDYDRDGDLDYYLSNAFGNVLLHNLGGLDFADFAQAARVSGVDSGGDAPVSWGSVFTDLDLDGWPDLAVVNGDEPWHVHYNERDGSFALDARAFRPENAAPGRFDAGLAAGDLDGDGDEDFVSHRVDFFTDRPEAPALMFWRNDVAVGAHWLRVRLVATASAPDGYGATITVDAGDGPQLQEIYGGGSYLSQSALARTFGLGEALSADVIVAWPSGRVDALRGVAADQELVVVEGGGAADTDSAPDPEPSEGIVAGAGRCGCSGGESAVVSLLGPWWARRRRGRFTMGRNRAWKRNLESSPSSRTC